MKPSLLKRIYFALKPANRLAIYDYPTRSLPLYTSHQPHKKLFEIISKYNPSYKKLIERVFFYHKYLQEIKDSSVETNPALPAWNNDFIPGLDIVLMYTLLAEIKPKHFVEIGSGTSTQTAFKVKQDLQLDFLITSIDPAPRKEIEALTDNWHTRNLQEVPLDIFEKLQAGDIVFFDGTHTLLPGSDVSWFFLEVLPILKPGVIVQIHDIYLPYDYPEEMVDRFYSEQYILGAILLANPDKYKIVAPAFYISQQEEFKNLLEELWLSPGLIKAEKHGGSFWFKINN